MPNDYFNGWLMSLKIPTHDPAHPTLPYPPGPYTISWTDPLDLLTTLSFVVTVVAAPTPNPTTIPVGGTRDDIQAAIEAGYSPIILSPGDYEIDTVLDLSAGSPADVVVIDGKGWASFTRLPEATTPPNKFIDFTRSLTLRGITFRGTKFDDFVLHHYPEQAVDVNVVNCRFENCSSGRVYEGQRRQ